jgi:hypothetical protein
MVYSMVECMPLFHVMVRLNDDLFLFLSRHLTVLEDPLASVTQTDAMVAWWL